MWLREASLSSKDFHNYTVLKQSVKLSIYILADMDRGFVIPVLTIIIKLEVV